MLFLAEVYPGPQWERVHSLSSLILRAASQRAAKEKKSWDRRKYPGNKFPAIRTSVVGSQLPELILGQTVTAILDPPSVKDWLK